MAIKGDLAHWEAEDFGVDLIDLTLGDLLDQRADEAPDKEALAYDYPEIGLELRLTYGQYRDVVNRLAKGLMAFGVEKGDHVAVWATNVPEWIFLQLALAKIGAVIVTINTNYRAAEIEYALRQGDISTIFLIEEHRGNHYLESLYGVAPEIKTINDPLNETLRVASLPRLKRAVLIGQGPRPGLSLFSDVMALAGRVSDDELKERQSSVSPRDVAMMQYTSGTTGFPKGVMLTHYNLVNQSHISFDPLKNLELFERQKGTFTFAVPTMLIAMLNHPRFAEFDLSALRRLYTGATPVPVPLMERIKEKIGADCVIVFGMTETTGAVTQSFSTDSFELKAETVGLAQPHTSIKIINPGTGETAQLGQSGELCSKAFSNMRGYYNMPEKTAETIDEEGWLHSGDLAVMRADGYVNIVGRVKDMIIRGGENVYPAEIEDFLMRHPMIAEAQVVGLPDEFMGEEVCALIRAKQGEVITADEVREYCKAGISRHKVPKFVRFVESFPLTASGKVKKFELRERLIREMGLEHVAGLKTA